MRRGGAGAEAQSVWKGVRTSNFGSAAAAQMRSQRKRVCELRFVQFHWGWGSMPDFMGLCASVFSWYVHCPGAKRQRVKVGRWRTDLDLKRKGRCAGLWVEEHVFGYLVKDWNMTLVSPYLRGSLLSQSVRDPQAFCWLSSQHDMFKHQKHTHHPPHLFCKPKEKKQKQKYRNNQTAHRIE